MKTGGWIKNSEGLYETYHPVNEVSILCNVEELETFICFLNETLNNTKIYGECSVHFNHYLRDHGKNAENDVVIIVN